MRRRPWATQFTRPPGTLDELNWMVRDAVVCHFDEPARPKIIRLRDLAGSDVGRHFDMSADDVAARLFS